MTTKIILALRKYVARGNSYLWSNVKDIANALVVMMYFYIFPKPESYSLSKIAAVEKHLFRDRM